MCIGTANTVARSRSVAARAGARVAVAPYLTVFKASRERDDSRNVSRDCKRSRAVAVGRRARRSSRRRI
jgi:hypothetical protein